MGPSGGLKLDGDLLPILTELRERPPGFVFNMVESFLATDRLAFVAAALYESAGVLRVRGHRLLVQVFSQRQITLAVFHPGRGAQDVNLTGP